MSHLCKEYQCVFEPKKYDHRMCRDCELNPNIDKLNIVQISQIGVGIPSAESDCSALRHRITNLEDGLRQIAVWKQEDQDDHDTCVLQWRGCVAIACELLKPNSGSTPSNPVECSPSFRSEVERISDDYMPENSGLASFALEEMRAALQDLLANSTENTTINTTVQNIPIGQKISQMTKDALQNEVALLRKTMRRIMSMAGCPDAAQACRNILAEVESVIKNINE